MQFNIVLNMNGFLVAYTLLFFYTILMTGVGKDKYARWANKL